MSAPQIIALAVLAAVVAALIHGKMRSDVVALAGAAVLLGTRTVRPVEVQGAFASPAIIALAALFVIAYAMELSGLLGLLIRAATRLCARMGSAGLWIVIALAGGASAFLNNTPIVVLAGPVVRDVAQSLKVSPKRFLIPLSYVTILGGACTLIGTSTNLLVNDMARNAGQPAFSLFEITPVGLIVALAGGLYLVLFSDRLISQSDTDVEPVDASRAEQNAPGDDPSLFLTDPPFQLGRALASLAVFVAVVAAAALGVAPIAATAFSGAVLLVLLRLISVDEAYRGLRPEVLFLIAGMVVVGLSLEVTGLAALATDALVGWVHDLGPWLALALIYGATLFLTEILSNAAVAVLLTPVAVALAESLGVDARPFLVGVMMAASAAFATPFGYQTNVLVYQLGRYSYLDFVKIGVPLNLLTWVVGVAVIPRFFPF
ncbi:MAG: SLC13 family permease [Alphaproteobacteria bacterium]|nr:SLC13 family permease [Alphaproteobacteria bacterium]MBU1516656.1 SLC13 family permease [Alphaproteobacteria bacterium]MBU2094412.1 SLC13 family permease [Alphaproteobacteria bacterium]MBU2152639.1 SLC13 family permease [Alphaproteobacteria bacterium]MBU2307584.1 SLC13 family permease [Alphaproteobacteria bacterium]